MAETAEKPASHSALGLEGAQEALSVRLRSLGRGLLQANRRYDRRALGIFWGRGG